MKVRLVRKHANCIDGIDLEGREPGDLLDLSPADAQLIVAEQWAIVERRSDESPSKKRRRVSDNPQPVMT